MKVKNMLLSRYVLYDSEKDIILCCSDTLTAIEAHLKVPWSGKMDEARSLIASCSKESFAEEVMEILKEKVEKLKVETTKYIESLDDSKNKEN